MSSEIDFIFSPALESWNNNDNTIDIYRRITKIKARKKNTTDLDSNLQKIPSTQTTDTTQAVDDAILIYKRPSANGGADVKNYLKDSVYFGDESDEDPYISLINYFTKASTKALRLKAGDFAYLKDLGVYPINRLWILRRFPDNAIVPNNLLAWGKAVEPISTVVGWIKPKDEGDLLGLSFYESWTDQNETLDKILGNILKDMGIPGSDKIVSVPGWSQGLLWGMLKAMGLTDDYGIDVVPTGDPNVLRTSKMRDAMSGQQALQSTLDLSLETSYEQKYINGIDPGMAMLDILGNLFKMGTSEQKFMLGNSPALQKLIGATYGSAAEGKDNFVNFIQAMVKSFTDGITNFITQLTTSNETTTTETPPPAATGTTTSSVISGIPSVNSAGISSAFNTLSTALLTGTVFKFRWPLKGSIALMCGINTTPWHLTIGNPYSPIINVGNIWVKNVDVRLSNDMGFNDMPARINASISCGLGRPLGRSELEKMFNNGYKRVYAKSSLGEANFPTNNSTASQVNATTNMSQNPGQPVGVLAAVDQSASNVWPPPVNSGIYQVQGGTLPTLDVIAQRTSPAGTTYNGSGGNQVAISPQYP